MVPRHRAIFVTTDLGFDGVVERVRETRLTRLPLCEPGGGLDAAIGLLHVKDLLVAQGREPDLQALARPLERVPESMLIDELLERLRRLREHFALVLDEHGTAVGLITLEDVLEEIVGEIEDEFDPEEREPIRQDGERTIVAGWAPLRLVEERLGFVLEGRHEATVGGVVLEHLGRLPDTGEEVSLDGVRFRVLAAKDAQIQELELLRDDQPPDA